MSKLRVEKVQELIKQELSMMLIREVKDPRVKGITITSVEVSGDLSYAKIYVSLFGSAKEQEEAWKGLNSGLGFYRSEIAKRVKLRVAPILTFVRDTSMAYSSHIEELLHKIKEDETKHE